MKIVPKFFYFTSWLPQNRKYLSFANTKTILLVWQKQVQKCKMWMAMFYKESKIIDKKGFL